MTGSPRIARTATLAIVSAQTGVGTSGMGTHSETGKQHMDRVGLWFVNGELGNCGHGVERAARWATCVFVMIRICVQSRGSDKTESAQRPSEHTKRAFGTV